MSLLRTFRGEDIPHLKIIEHRRWWFALSGLLLAVSIVALATGQVHLSIDFEGGASLSYPIEKPVTVAHVRTALGGFGRADAEVQIVDGNEVVIRMESLGELKDRRTELLQTLSTQAGVLPDDINVEDIGPSWGQAILRRMVMALVVFLVAVSIYIAFRFEWKMAVGALIALFHDVVITAGIYVLVGREITPETVIAILTILGFSLYDTVVIYDKVQENTATPALIGKRTYADVVNTSLNQTIMRSVNTSLVVLLPILSLLLFGGDTLKDFAFALFVGVAVGTYSSIFVAAPALVVLKEREPRYQAARQRATARADKALVAATSADAGPPGAPDTEPKLAPTPKAGHDAVVVAPRPRKKKSAAKRKRR